MAAALVEQGWDVVLADYNMPRFSALEALELLKESGLDLPLIIVSGSIGEETAVAAMKAGARDFLLHSEITEVLESVNTICDELTERVSSDGKMICVVNAKGGAGATFLACNLAHLAASVSDEASALIGFDMQFPTLPSYFDLKLKHGLLPALESADELDTTALDAIMASHPSGLKLLAARPEDFRFSFESLAEQANMLLDLLFNNFRHVVVDMPRHIDEFNAQVISRASNIVMVVQQSLPHIQDATRLQQLLRDQLGISHDNLLVVVNRYDKRAEIQLTDIEKALPGSQLMTVPNQYKEVSESINLGIPMYEYARHSAVSRALVALQSKLFGHASTEETTAATGRISSLLQKTPLHQLFGDK